MPSIKCASIECKYNGRNNACTAKRVLLTATNVMTVNDGRQDFWWCKCFEEADDFREVREKLERFLGKAESEG